MKLEEQRKAWIVKGTRVVPANFKFVNVEDLGDSEFSVRWAYEPIGEVVGGWTQSGPSWQGDIEQLLLELPSSNIFLTEDSANTEASLRKQHNALVTKMVKDVLA